jgi:RNA polymerase sigma-70 factor (ECF subfamily)
MTAMDATAHGSVAETRGSDGREPTAAPQRWQNFAPAESDERQAAHTAPSNGAPHEEQKRPPVDGALHEGQVAGVVIGETYYTCAQMNPPSAGSAYPSDNVDEDRELVRRMSAGETRALAQFYERWSRSVHALVVRLVRDPDDADDVVEDTFYQAWRQASRYEPSRGAVSTWIVTIARSRALDRLRSRRRLREEPLTPVSVIDELADSAYPDPAAGAEEAERRERVAEALRELPAEQREVLELAYFGGLSQTEIAERTGQPLGTVKTRTRLAGQKLRERLAALRGGAERV